jgi:hypothetical protein
MHVEDVAYLRYCFRIYLKESKGMAFGAEYPGSMESDEDCIE